MSPAIELLLTFAKAFGLVIGMMILLTIIMIVFLDLWGKKMSAGHVYCFFWANKQFTAKLLEEDTSEKCVHLGHGENKEKYNLKDSNQGWAMWPPGVPKIIQTPVRAYEFFRNQPDGRNIDSEATSATMTARTNRMITDEIMLKQTWKDIRESLGIRTGKFPIGINVLTTIVILLAIGVNIYLTYDMVTTLEFIKTTFGGGIPTP